ncbi:MAG: GTP pyrophosphokinase family protein [Eubacteriales bacterium]|nr:GTP pyrophosphokinase family protein [Eubacteriales bacterium]
MTPEEQEIMMGRVQPFLTLMMQYRCAIREMETKLHVLNDEFSMRHERNPFESIESRIKQPDSILEKMRRKGYRLTVNNIEEKLNDVAGVRVICSFVEDIYYLANMLAAQDDLHVLEVKDYIKNPKDNGYRSLHLIIEIPIFLSSEKKNMKVEVQFRTIAMDFWASLDHKLKYKKNVKNPELIVAELKKCADTISGVDLRMQEIRNMMEEGEM